MSQKKNISQLIKDKAQSLGFTSVGIAKADILEEERGHLIQWLDNKFHGDMHYMRNHFEKRLDPRKLVEDAQSVIVLTHNYYPERSIEKGNYNIAKYAYGEDYHIVLKDKLKVLLSFIEEKAGSVKARIFTDSAPVMERQWAVKAGLGWQGKNTLLIQKDHGSYFFLAEIILNIPLEYDQPFKTDHCGTCTRCIDACPTQAILPDRQLNASKCISYLTIELKDDIPETFKNKWDNWIFGCDICQDVCPWNKQSKPHREPRFFPKSKLFDMLKTDWETLNQYEFDELFEKSAVKRATFSAFKKTIDFIKK